MNASTRLQKGSVAFPSTHASQQQKPVGILSAAGLLTRPQQPTIPPVALAAFPDGMFDAVVERG
eukprot:CAMPEP_0172082112 /NCGR_PEP_ID=MMETSP1043-20130122/19678_1 /TAXON_ID=464988 /ORGANISM="Hemiselmis andersenii, Strain CCMP441" /LENGTH=63 /DNA_ID=CAMNT_0012743631 /DNA_START=1 /DNA_END=189 /DNA_ORIENTATION=+